MAMDILPHHHEHDHTPARASKHEHTHEPQREHKLTHHQEPAHAHPGGALTRVKEREEALLSKKEAAKAAHKAAAAQPRQSPYSAHRVMAIFASLMVAMFVSSLAETMTATALPTIVGDLGGVEMMQWVTTAYILASTVSMPIYGKIGDLTGRKYLMLGALGLYSAGSVVCALTPSMIIFICARVVSGLGGGGIILLSQAIIADVTTPRERGKYLGFIGSVFSVSATIGPLLGGWFVQVTGWRWLFAVNAALAALALVTTAVLLHQKRHKLTQPADVFGMVTMALAVTSLVLVVSWGGTVYPWISVEVLGALGVFIVTCGLFIYGEHRAKEPIIPLSLFKNRNFLLVTAATFIVMIGQMGVDTYLPTYLQITAGLTPIEAGLMTFPMVVGLSITAIATGFIAAKTGHYKWMCVACLAVSGVGLGLLGTMSVATSLILIGVYLFVLGFGIGFGEQIFVLIVQNEFSQKIVGTATGANNFFRQIGSTIGASLVGTVFTSRLVAHLAPQIPAGSGVDLANITPQALEHVGAGLRHTIEAGYAQALAPIFLFLVPLFAVGVIICCFIKENALATTIQHGSQTDDEV